MKPLFVIFKKGKQIKLLYAAIIIVFFLPLATAFFKAFANRNALDSLWAFINSRVFTSTLSFSAREAFFSAFFSLLFALPGAYFFGNFRFLGKKLMHGAMFLPFMLPGILVVLGMVICYGNNGVFNHLLSVLFPEKGWVFSGLYGFWGIVMANVFYNLTFCIRIMGEGWERIDIKLREASSTLGANGFYTWLKITLPLLSSTITYLFAIVFLYSFLSFTVVLVLGGYLYKTFEILIYIEYNNKLNFDNAARIAALQTLILAGVLYLQFWFGKRMQKNGKFTNELPRLRLRKQPAQSVFFSLYLFLIALFSLSPMFMVIKRSFNKNGLAMGALSFNNYQLLFTDGFRFAVGKSFLSVFSVSLGLAVIVAFFGVSIAYCLARMRRTHSWGLPDIMLQLPVGVSFLTFAFGLLILTGRYIPAWAQVIWAQVFLSFPLVYSILRTAWRELGETVLDAAMVLGANSSQIFWTIELPLMRKAISTAFVYAMAVSLGDLAAVLTLGKGEIVTLSIAIYRLIGHYRFAQATALGAIFILFSLSLFLIGETRFQIPFTESNDAAKNTYGAASVKEY